MEKLKNNIAENTNKKFISFMLIGLLLLILMSLASIFFGAANMSIKTAWDALFSFDSNITEHQIIQTFRVPRVFANIIVGCSLAICGAIMQGTTQNPLVDSGLMGISSGSTFAIAFAMAFLPGLSYGKTMGFAFIGAGLATFLTYFVASMGKKGMTPEKLVLSGLSISMLFGAFSQYLSIRYRLAYSLAYWTAGGSAGVKMSELLVVLPFFIIGVVASVSLSPSITLLNLGEDVATGLGLKTKTVKLFSTLVVLVLTGLSVVIVGPVGFIGLIIPHMVRYFIGIDYRYVIPAAGLYGSVFTVGADLLGRLINKPYETPIGVILSLVGVPYFLYLSRSRRGRRNG